jgi:hypothetical protein
MDGFLSVTPYIDTQTFTGQIDAKFRNDLSDFSRSFALTHIAGLVFGQFRK